MAAGFKSLLAFWLGRAGVVPTTPVTVTDIRMGQLTMRSGMLSMASGSGSLGLETDSGLLSLRDESGSCSLRMNNGSLELVITS